MTTEDTNPSAAMTTCTLAVRALDHSLITLANLIEPGDSPLALTREQAEALIEVLSNSSVAVNAYKELLTAMLDYAESAGVKRPCH